MPPPRIRRQRRRLRPQRRRRMHRTPALPWPTRTSRTTIKSTGPARTPGSAIITLIKSTRTGRSARTTHQRLTRTHRTGINRTPRHRTRRTRRHPRTRRRRRSRCRRTRTQSRHHVGTRRHHRTRGGLTSQIGTLLRPQGCSGRWHCPRSRHRRGRSSRRYGLSRSRQDLTWTRRRNGPGRNRTRA